MAAREAVILRGSPKWLAPQDDAASLGGTGDPLRAAVAPRSVCSNELIDAER